MLFLLLACDGSDPAERQQPAPNRRGTSRVLTVDSAGAAEFADIGSAVADATSGDTIEVAAGRYFGAIDFEGKAVHIIGTEGPESTWIYATPGQPAVVAKQGEGRNAILEGFTVTGGGGALEPVVDQSFSSLTLRDVHFTGNAGRVVVYARSAIVTLDRVEITADNVAYDGWVIEGRRGMVAVKDSTIACGSAGVGYLMEHGAAFLDGNRFDCPGAAAAQIFHSNGRVQRTVFDGHLYVENEEAGEEPTTVEGSILLGGVGVKLCTLNLYNTVVTGGGITAFRSGLVVQGSILYGNQCAITDDEASTSAMYNLFFENTANGCGIGDPVGSSSNIEGDPLFTDGPGRDFRLQGESPAIDAGSGADAFADLDGSKNDLGAYGGPFSMAGGW